MFGKQAKKKIRSSHITTLIGQGSEIQGDLVFTGGLHIDGTIKGNVRAAPGADSAMIVLGELGVIEGDVTVPDVLLNGSVFGSVRADSRVELGPSAKVTGSVIYRLIEMASGAEINGSLIRDTETESSRLDAPPSAGGKNQADEFPRVLLDSREDAEHAA